MFPGKESPWSILGLDGASATVREVKRAYARLLKQFRPDADPEGFRRIHEAYGAVLAEIQLRDESGEASGPPADPEAPAAPAEVSPPELPAPFLAGVAVLQATPDLSAPDKRREALTQLRLVCGGDPRLWLEWSRTLAKLLADDPSENGLAPLLGTDDVLFELRAGAMEVADRMLHYWHRQQFTAAMEEVGKALTNPGAGAAYDHPACGFFALRLAFRLAFAQPGGASLLLDCAFAWLPPAARSPLPPVVENRLAIGRLFWHLPATWQPWWEKLLDDLEASKPHDWSGPEARRAISVLLQLTPRDWPGWGFIQEQLPPLQWENVVRSVNSRPSRRLWTAPPARSWATRRPDGYPGGDTPPPAWAARRRNSTPGDDDLWEIDDSDPPARPPLPAEAPADPGSRESGKAEPRRTRSAPRRREPRYHYQKPKGLRQRWQRLPPGGKLAAGCFLMPVALVLSFMVIMFIISLVQQFTDSRVAYSSEAACHQRITAVLANTKTPRQELDAYLQAPAEERRRMMEARAPNPALLVCVILHPEVPADQKRQAIDTIADRFRPEQAIAMLSDATVADSPANGMLRDAIVKIYGAHWSELPEDMRRNLGAVIKASDY